MSALDVTALGGLALLGAAFFLGRFGELAFVVLGAGVVVASAVVAGASGAPTSERLLLVAGLGAWFLGLGIVRIMVHRSVSLRLLGRCGSGRDETGEDAIRARLSDIDRFGLVTKRAGEYGLSAAGRVLASVLGVVYRLSQVGA